MKSKAVHIDTLAGVCGFHTSQTDANNGYGCNHPEQEEYEYCHEDKDGYMHRSDDLPQVKQGKCYAFSCPLADECYIETEQVAYHYENGDTIGEAL